MADEVKTSMFNKMSDTTKWVSAVIGLLVLIGGAVWGTAVWVTNANAKGVKTDKLEEKMDNVQKALESQKRSQDSLKSFVIDYAKKSDVLQASYVLWVQEHSATVNDIVHSLQGLTFEFVPTEKSEDKSTIKPSAKIRIVPVKPRK
jgi:uncharacterized membrane-anchored protein YhcB (DUF1043 family)